MGLSQRAAADALGLSLPGYQEQERGASYAGVPRTAPMTLLLACAAVERKLRPIE